MVINTSIHTLESLNKLGENTLVSHLGIEITDIGESFISGKMPVDWNAIIFKALTIKGIYGREMFETWYKMIAMLQSGLNVRGVITHRLKAADYAAGFNLMKQGSCGKVVLDWA